REAQDDRGRRRAGRTAGLGDGRGLRPRAVAAVFHADVRNPRVGNLLAAHHSPIRACQNPPKPKPLRSHCSEYSFCVGRMISVARSPFWPAWTLINGEKRASSFSTCLIWFSSDEISRISLRRIAAPKSLKLRTTTTNAPVPPTTQPAKYLSRFG